MFTPSEAEYQILSKLSSASLPMPLSAFENEDHQRIHRLIQNKFILRSWEGGLLSISALGLDALSAKEQAITDDNNRRSERAEEKHSAELSERKREIRSFRRDIALLVIGGVITLIVEHVGTVISIVKSLWLMIFP